MMKMGAETISASTYHHLQWFQMQSKQCVSAFSVEGHGSVSPTGKLAHGHVDWDLSG
jgi:hypothetical protein